MLAYAAQGLLGDEAGGTGAQLRDFLSRCSAALAGLPPLLRTLVEAHQSEPAAAYQAFIDIVERDARYTHTALQLAWRNGPSARSSSIISTPGCICAPS